MPEQLLLDLPIAPETALARLEAGINRRPERALGVLKIHNEFVGAVVGDRFEIWERHQRAIHAVGRARARRGGTRVEVRFPLSLLARGLLVAFAALYVIVAAGIATQPPDPSLTPDELVITATGAVLIAALFYGSARRQRRDLSAHVSAILDPRDAHRT